MSDEPITPPLTEFEIYSTHTWFESMRTQVAAALDGLAGLAVTVPSFQIHVDTVPVYVTSRGSYVELILGMDRAVQHTLPLAWLTQEDPTP